MDISESAGRAIGMLRTLLRFGYIPEHHADAVREIVGPEPEPEPVKARSLFKVPCYRCKGEGYEDEDGTRCCRCDGTRCCRCDGTRFIEIERSPV